MNTPLTMDVQQAMLQMQQQHQQDMSAMQVAMQAAIQAAVPLQQAAVQHAPSAASGHGKPRLPAPPAYKGKTTELLEEWIGDMQQQIGWYASMTPTEQVQFASMYLQGDARVWLSQLIPAPVDWPSLKSALISRFQPITTAETARSQLYILRQGTKTTNEYVSSFRRQLAHVPDMSNADQLFHFLRGVKDKTAVALRTANVQTLTAAIDLAVRVGTYGEQAAASASASSASSGSGSAPMDLSNIEGLDRDAETTDGDNVLITREQHRIYLNAMRDQRPAHRTADGQSRRNEREGRSSRPMPRIPHLTEDQVREYMVAGKCFGCGSKDHVSRFCPRRTKGADGRVSWTPAN